MTLYSLQPIAGLPGSGGSSPPYLEGRHGPIASAVVRAYNGGLVAEPPAGSRGRVPGQGIRGGFPPEAKALLGFQTFNGSRNLPTFLKFGNANKSDICAIFAKNYGWPRNWRGLEQNWRPMPPRSGLKPPLLPGRQRLRSSSTSGHWLYH